jgi:mycothiol system anti-sigma-R factor
VSESIDRLTCEEMFRRLDDYLDRALAASELARIEEHLAHCARCASEYAFDGTVVRELKAKLARVQAPPSLLDSIRKRIAEN